MNRRQFFKWLGIGAAAAVVAPSALAVCEDPWCGSELPDSFTRADHRDKQRES